MLKSATAVDHFIPWSRYPRDTAINFVLAHAACNARKRELLAGRLHLDQWLGFVAEKSVTAMIAHWAYQQAINQGSQAWLRGQLTEPITHDRLLAFA